MFKSLAKKLCGKKSEKKDTEVELLYDPEKAQLLASNPIPPGVKGWHLFASNLFYTAPSKSSSQEYGSITNEKDRSSRCIVS